MPSVNLFSPAWNGTVVVVATSGAAKSTTITTSPGCNQLRIKNVSATNVAFVAIGTAAVVATVSGGMPIGLGETVGVTRDPNSMTTISAIVAADTATIYCTPGDGV